jgi:preprotein translocase subunit SecY
MLVSLTGGTYLVIWMAELISAWGVRGQGFNAIVFSGAALVLFEDMYKSWQGAQGLASLPLWQGTSPDVRHWLGLAVYILALLLGLVIIVYLSLGKRDVPLMYPGRVSASRFSMPVKATLPINLTWIWQGATDAQSLLAFPLLVSLFFVCSPVSWLQRAALSVQSALQPDSLWAGPLLALTILLFAPFLADASFAEQNYGENLKRAGAQIPGVHSGAPTQKYLQRIFRRVTVFPAVLATMVLLIPWIVNILFGMDALLLAGEALFLVFAFTHNTLSQFEADLKLYGYQERKLVL